MIAAVAMVKDEIDVVGDTVGRMAEVCDLVIVADNGSTDGTREALDELDVTVIDDSEVGYYQSPKMTALAYMAGEAGADWVIPFDADEVWHGRHGGLTSTLEGMPREALIAEAVLFDHVATAADVPAASPIEEMIWRRRDPAPLRKVAVRPKPGLVIHQGNHSATFEDYLHPYTVTGCLEVRHFPYRSVEQFVSKVRNGAAAYAATDLPDAIGAHWRGYGRILEEHGEEGINDIFRRWFWRERPDEEIVIDGEHQPALVNDPCPLR